MTDEKSYIDLLSENLRIKKADLTRKNAIILLLVLLIVFGFYLAIDMRIKFESSIKLNDAKRDLWLRQATNVIERNRQQIDSLSRLDNSIKRGNDSLNLKLEFINNCR